MTSTVAIEQDDPFFLKPQTFDALSKINDLDGVVIYCGAGVTIDQTGVSWTQLIREVFGVALGSKTGNLRRHKSVEFLLSALDDPRQKASIVAELFRQEKVAENDFLKSALLPILYTKGSWSTGQILRNIALFANLATLFGRNVTIITTNYDAFIEDDIDTRYRGLVEDGKIDQDRAPRVFRTVYEPGRATRHVEITPGTGGAGSIELIYLHGRVDRAGDAEGVIVLTEESYARTREQSKAVLMEHFRRQEDGSSKAVLIVGASLTDGPLIDALALTHERKPPAGCSPQVRVALTDMPMSPSDLQKPFETRITGNEISSTHVQDALALRGRHLGVEILWPASHAQAAQFLEELRVEEGARRRHNRTDAYTAEEFGVSYPARLKRWETQFAASQTLSQPEFVHDELANVLRAVKAKLTHDVGFDAKHEVLRLELWARVKPSSRQLVLIGNSVGPLRDQDAFRKEFVDETSNASVLAFLEGRPLLKSVDELGLDVEANRWQTFFSVPIFVHVEAENDHGGGRIPTGVITLASTLSVEHATDDKWSCFRDLETAMFEFLRSDLLIPTGKGLLSPGLVGARWNSYLARTRNSRH